MRSNLKKIRAAGFDVVKLAPAEGREILNQFTKRTKKYTLALTDKNGKFLYYENEIYTPIGGINTFEILIKDINLDCFSFRDLDKNIFKIV